MQHLVRTNIQGTRVKLIRRGGSMGLSGAGGGKKTVWGVKV